MTDVGLEVEGEQACVRGPAAKDGECVCGTGFAQLAQQIGGAEGVVEPDGAGGLAGQARDRVVGSNLA